MNQDNSPLNEKGKVELPTKKQAESVLDVTSLPKKPDTDSVDTSMLDEQWAALSQDWQAQPVVKTDIQALLKQTKKRTLWAKSCFVLNILATIGLLASFLYGVVKGEFGRPDNTFFGLGGLTSLIFVYYEIKIRAAAWRNISESPDQAIESAIAGCQSSIRYMMLNKWSCIPFGLLGNWFVYTLSQETEKSAFPAYLFVNIFIVIVYIGAEMLLRKRRREMNELERRLENI